MSPVITGPGSSTGATSAISVAENTKAVHTFTASETVTWSIASGADGSKFAISSTGALSFVQAPDYESPADNGTNNTYEVAVVATDAAGNASTQTVTITVTNIIEAGVIVTPVDGSLLEDPTGGPAFNGSFDVVLSHKPLANVVLALSSSDLTEGTVQSSVTFTPQNWNFPQRITVNMVDDLIGDGAQSFTIETGDVTSSDADYNSLGAADVADVAMTTQNNDPPGIVWELLSSTNRTTEAGGTVVIGFKLLSQPAVAGADVTIPLSLTDASEGSLSSVSSVTIKYADWNNSASNTVTITGIDDNALDGDIVYSMVTGVPSSTDPDYNALLASDVADVELVNADVTAPNPPVVAPSNGTVVTGTAEANSSVIISMTSGGTTTTATVQTDGSGNFSYTPATALANGTTVTATAYALLLAMSGEPHSA